MPRKSPSRASTPRVETRINLVARDLADADARLVEVLELVNGRVPGWFTDKLISLSDHLWQQRRFDCDADHALARVKVIKHARSNGAQNYAPKKRKLIPISERTRKILVKCDRFRSVQSNLKAGAAS